jgi:hypothetical protein
MENLFSPTALPDSTGEVVPSYLMAADNHNVGNSLGGSWFDPDTWETKFNNSGKFIATAILSGADSLYNSAATVGKWVGVGDGGHDTADFISSLDDDLGKYYQENRTAVDLVGFIGSSFIPGIGGIKVLNAGQAALKAGIASGEIGGNLARATGLLVPKTQVYMKQAAQEIVSSTGATSALNISTLKALGSGAWQNVLEAAAFETAVQATMFKSPVLEGQDAFDIAKNIAFGGLVGGAIGGAIEGARTYGGIKKLVQGEVVASKPFSSRVQPLDATPASQKMILAAEDRDMTAVPVKLEGDNYPLGDSGYANNQKLLADKIEKSNNYIRSQVNSLVKGTDGTIGNMVADALHNTPASDLLTKALHLEEVATIGTKTAIEKLATKAVKALDIGALTPLETRYLKLTGEGAGNVLDDAPVVINLADKVKTKAGYSVEQAVRDEVKSYKFSTKNPWEATALKGNDAHFEAEARYIWARNLPEFSKEITVHETDIPLLERIYSDLSAGKSVSYKLAHADGSIGAGYDAASLLSHLTNVKDDVANKLLQSMVMDGSQTVEAGTSRIAKIVNMKESALTGTRNEADPMSDLFAKQHLDEVHHENLVKRGLRNVGEEPADTAFMPSYAKLAYNTKDLKDVNGNILDAMTWIKQNQKLYQEAADRVFAKNAGELNDKAIPISDSVLINANLKDGGAGLTSFANGGYGSLGSYMQHIGANVTRPLKEAFRKKTAEVFLSPLVKMGNKQEAAIEFDVINNKIASTMEQYVLDHEGHSGQDMALISKKIRDYTRARDKEVGQEGMYAGKSNLAVSDIDKLMPKPVLQKGAPEYITIKNPETYEVIQAHISNEGRRTIVNKEINAVAGKEDNKVDDIFRPLRPNPNDYPFFAFVKDEKVTGAGHTTMIHAATKDELQKLADKIPTDKGYKVIYKDQAEEFYKARGEYEYSRTLNENYVDSDLKSRGINSQFFPKTDPQKIVDDLLQHHFRGDDITAIELMRMKYQPTFDWLEDQGKQFSKIESSQYGSALNRVEKYGKNPYTDYTKTALDVSKASEFGLLYSANRGIDKAVSNVYGMVSDVFRKSKSPAELDTINNILQDHGMNNAYYDAATEALANHSAPKGVLSKFIRSSNAILSKFTLALDPLNGLNNAIGANILRSTELKQLTDAINGGNKELAGQLAGLAKVNLPNVGDSIVSPAKLLASSLKRFAADDGTLLKQYKSEGLIKDSLSQFKDIMDDFTLRGTETVAELDKRVNSAYAKAKKLGEDAMVAGEKYSGNKFFEEFNRFMSADVMKQITDLGEQHGLMTSAEAMAYRNTFVNRVEGNTIASQRPVMFQGPIGQAVGLFQSYQFNLMQQMFRYISEGTGKDAAMLMGLQGTFYGINGLPAFNAVNSHIIGNLSGNKNHTDMYDMTYGVAGKSLGDFLMYGVPSSIIQTNLYSRGDINPRQLTIIPTDFSSIPIISAYGKALSNLKETVTKVATGGNVWESILQGVEHNGISRPLAGLAQVAQATTGNGMVFSTSNKGTILGSNDLLSLASLSRLAGGRPLDEAVINDGTYRIQAYEAAQKKAKDALTEKIKTTGISGQSASPDQIAQFAAEYAAVGGKQNHFNKYLMDTYKKANTPQAEVIKKQLSSPFAQKMQILMGGRNELDMD